MANDISDLMRRAVDTAVPVVRGVSEEWFPAKTPCADYDVRALLNHLFAMMVNFQALARKEAANLSGAPGYLSGDWRARFEAETTKLIEEWSRPEALEGVSAGMGLPQRTIAQMALLDLTVHSWDLAKATGQEQRHHPDPGVVAGLFETFTEMAPMARKTGVFGEPVAVPDSASTFERLLGVSGRDPGWTP